MQTINGSLFKRMVNGGVKLLEINKEEVDSLNVFPVPDGDTGTNMLLTVKTAATEVNAVQSEDISEIATAFSKGALKGARGNSGVITSQIFKGFTIISANKAEFSVDDFAEALKKGTEIAYSAVTKPKEGTILTVIRTMAEKAMEVTSKRKSPSVENLLEEVLRAGDEVLAKTPDMLPVLKRAGVVDAGGKGLMYIMRGFYNIVMDIELPDAPEMITHQEGPKPAISLNAFAEIADDHEHDINFGYCTEYFISNFSKSVTNADIDKLRDYLMTIGDCVLVIGDLNLVKVHVHTNNPDKALKHALLLGEIDKVKVENMLEQNRKLLSSVNEEAIPEELKEIGMVSICAGKGMEAIFKDLLVDKVVEGGQTMNPSVYDILNAVNSVNAKNVIVFPNNKNIILAAEQARDMADKKVYVIPTVNSPQGISAALAFTPDSSIETNIEAMTAAIGKIQCGQVTHAVRSTRMNGFSVKSGDIIGLNDKTIIAKGSGVDEVAELVIDYLKTDNTEVITLYYGEEVEEESANTLAEKLTEKYGGSADVIAYSGGQPHYYYLISLE